MLFQADMQPTENGVTKIVPELQLYDSLGFTYDYPVLFPVGLISLMILIPACSNYANLSILQSLERMKEIGMSKVMGGQKKQIFFQFIVQSIIIVLPAVLICYVISDILRKDFVVLLAIAGIITVPVMYVLFSYLRPLSNITL